MLPLVESTPFVPARETPIVRIGLHAGHEHSSLDDLIRLWKMADTGGFYWVSVWDHIIPFSTVPASGDCHEALACLAALAYETKQVRIGCLVFCIGFRHPVVLAKHLATLDHLSGGRLEIGLGAGWNYREHVPFGLPFPSMGTRLGQVEEGMQIMRRLLRGERISFKGKHFQIEDAWCHPRPLQSAPRVWIGGAGEKRTLQIAARYADGWNIAYISPQVYAHKNAVLNRWCDREGREPSDITRSVNLGFYMGTNNQQARLEAKRYNNYFAQQADEFREGTLFGTPNAVIDRLGEYAEAGVTDLNITQRAPYDFDAMQSFVEDVLPKL